MIYSQATLIAASTGILKMVFSPEHLSRGSDDGTSTPGSTVHITASVAVYTQLTSHHI